MFIARQKLSNALKSLKSKKSLQESTNRASECHSPHPFYNSLLRMRAIHELKRKNTRTYMQRHLFEKEINFILLFPTVYWLLLANKSLIAVM